MQESAFRVLDQYRKDSDYSDKIGKRYHFPNKYRKLLSLPNTQFIYHEPKRKGAGEYFGCGQIGNVTPDPADPEQFFADILNYRPFLSPVPDSSDQGKPRELGPFYNAQNAVRKVDPSLFTAICKEGGIETHTQQTESKTPNNPESMVSATADPIMEALQTVCSFCRDYPKRHGGLPTDDEQAILVKKNLRILADWLQSHLGKHKGVSIRVRPTAGAGAFPRVPWVCLLPPDQEVTKGIYAGICFDMEGRGILAGCLRSVANKVALPTIIRTGKGSLSIDVGDFNNAYSNPLEMRADELDQGKLLDHLSTSLDIALSHISTPATILNRSTMVLSSDQMAVLWKRFHSAIAGFANFQDPGTDFVQKETGYKRSLLTKFKNELGREKLLTLLEHVTYSTNFLRRPPVITLALQAPKAFSVSWPSTTSSPSGM
jgi:hypothetical protein